MKTATTASIKDFQKEVEEVADELNDQMEGVFDGPELDIINFLCYVYAIIIIMCGKFKHSVLHHFWSICPHGKID